MSQQNVEIVQRGYEHFRETGEFREGVFGPGFVWDMSTFRGWPEQRTYEGIEGARQFIRDGKQAYMAMYASPEETLEAAGLAE